MIIKWPEKQLRINANVEVFAELHSVNLPPNMHQKKIRLSLNPQLFYGLLAYVKVHNMIELNSMYLIFGWANKSSEHLSE